MASTLLQLILLNSLINNLHIASQTADLGNYEPQIYKPNSGTNISGQFYEFSQQKSPFDIFDDNEMEKFRHCLHLRIKQQKLELQRTRMEIENIERGENKWQALRRQELLKRETKKKQRSKHQNSR